MDNNQSGELTSPKEKNKESVGAENQTNNGALDNSENNQDHEKVFLQASENTQTGCDCAPGPTKLPSSLKNQVTFYLHIQRFHANEAYIKFDQWEQPLYLNKFKKCDEGDLWQGFVGISDSTATAISYRYHVSVSSNLPWPLSSDPKNEAEAGIRTVKSAVQYDTFHSKDDKKYLDESLPQSSAFYTSWLLKCINDKNIKEILMQIESLKFKFGSFLLQQTLAWILEEIHKCSVSDEQCLYLCVLLGHLAKNNSSKFVSNFLKENKAKESSDRVLKSLSALATFNLLPSSSLEILEKIASTLVATSSHPCWLSLAAHFYSYLGQQYVTQVKMSEQNEKCDAKEFCRLTSMLLSAITIDKETQQLHQQLLYNWLHAAPDLKALLHLYEVLDLDFRFDDGIDKEDIFVEIIESCHYSRKYARDNPGEHLLKLSEIPKQLLSKMESLVHESLLGFSTAIKQPTSAHVNKFLELMELHGKCLSTQNAEFVFTGLAHSTIPQIHAVLLQMLNSTVFQSSWYRITLEQKVDICYTWISTKLRERRCTAEQKPAAAYEAVEELALCKLNVENTELVAMMCKKVANEALKYVEASTIIRAYKSIEKCSERIQEYYKDHVKQMLQRDPRLVKKAVIEVDGSSSSSPTLPCLSRLGQDLLLYVLEVMEICSEDGNKEDVFRDMLEWVDVWITLFKVKGNTKKLQNNKIFKLGKNYWEVLAFFITEGNISLEFLKDIERNSKKLSFICAIVNANKPNDSYSDLMETKKMYSTRISELRQVHNDCGTKFSVLEAAINYGKKVSEDIYPVDGIPELISEFNQRKEKWQTTKQLNEWDDNNVWGVLGPLLKPAKTLKRLVNSVSFRNIAKICLQELIHARDSSSAEDEKSTNDFHFLLQFLTSDVVNRFSNQWGPVFSNPGTVTLKTAKTLLRGLNSVEELEKEFEFLGKHFRREFSADVKQYIECYVNYPSVLKQVKHLVTLLNMFGLNEPLSLNDDAASDLTSFVSSLENTTELSLENLHQSMLSVYKIVSDFTGDEIESVIEELGTSNELHDFLKEIVDEDIRFLIDAVEEHSDQFVSESSVSYLIDVHGFLAPLIKKSREECDAKNFLATLKHLFKVYNNMAIKVNQCSANVNSLKGLYTSVANRGEITKEIVANCLKKGQYSVALSEDGVCEAKMSYERKEQSAAIYSLSDLHDLRSRAHLIVNSDKKASPVVEKYADIDFSNFIKQVNLLTEINALLLKLRSSGYTKYRKFWRMMKGTPDLQCTKNKLQEELEEWERILSEARKKYYFLYYYRSDQLCVLHDFFTCRSMMNSEDVLSLIHFIDPNINKEKLEEYRQIYQARKQSNPIEDPCEMISFIGDALDELFAETSAVVRPMFKNTNDVKDQTSSFASQFNATVKPGELFVASLEPESPLTANVILTLYENTSNAFPEPYQVVFCGTHTTWEEVYLVLQRCFAQSEQIQRDNLFCLANVELLGTEIQFKLVNAIKELLSESPLRKAGHCLALICRGGDHHHIVEQFSQYAHHIAGMSDSTLSERLVTAWPEVSMVTSSLPGLGKTERIKKEVLLKKKNIVTCSISGPLDQAKLVQRLKSYNLKEYQCLHLDVGEVNKPLWLDTFLFQLIVVGMVSSGTQFYHLPTKHVYIEVANSLKDWLRDSLVICKYFARVHLQWQNYEDLVVSSEITSNIQVVCQYFDAFDKARLESKDIHFRGPKKVKPLPANRCRELLARHFSSDADMTFTNVNTFLAVLADQLLKFSKSAFFKIANLKSMLGKATNDVRTVLFNALLEVSKEFASRSITTCRSNQSSTTLSQEESAKALDKVMATSAMSAKQMVERVEGMIKWEDSNHLLVVFHGISSQTITAVYRNKTRVPLNVEKLLTSQVVKSENKGLEDFKVMSQEQLHETLEKIACTKPVMKDDWSGYLDYALTPDNILKMILIILRVRANAPVVIMGETGCGKTSLVRYLAHTCRVPFVTFNFHAGITEEEVSEFIIKQEDQVQQKSGEQLWVFLDEINTCDHLGLINDIMCHRTLLGRPLSKNLVFLAACNPYKLRPKEQIKTAGLEWKNVTDEYSRLVYRVNPLPEAMIDYVWDYGSLALKDEKAYIERMVRGLPLHKHESLLVDLLAESQTFTRKAEKNHFCVSLRDVHRCIRLTGWFMNMFKQRKKIRSEKGKYDQRHLKTYHLLSERYDSMPLVKSIVLALAHCYHSRLPTAELRREYRQLMVKLFGYKGTMMNTLGEVDSFLAIVRMEEEDYLDRMELPSGTARNAALRENVFVMLVCILNQIPVFVVGKPGCSKSLSIQLIRSNLRGRDSKDPLFRELPQLYVVSYQGSESSTSEGIIKVFQKASKYKSHNQGGNVLPVVLLDEVGLAENSKYNPLKVLHNLLEPGDGKLPDVAVVGISNWSLDAAKMNRAIHLSRPDPDEDDLYETGLSLHQADGTGIGKRIGSLNGTMGNKELRCLAEAYFEYQSKQRYANFHGLRDYYSLIKSLSLRGGTDFQKINMALQRNFGGILGELTNIQKMFLVKLEKCIISNLSSKDEVVPVTKLIQENLADPLARHLMLITSRDSAIGILKQSLAQLEKEIITIYGSRFQEDLSEEYNYRILSRIILCMERNCVLILRDLESIYGSLYDMLNQNYAVVGKRKNCRIALGAYNNPMCQVNDGFRCIVLTDRQKVTFSDPPFLNRFEKQLLRFSDVLDTRQQTIIDLLRHWVKQISIIQDHESHFNEMDMFIGYHEDTLSSLVLLHSQNSEDADEDIVQKCKDDLMWIAAPDGVLRAHVSDRLKDDSSEVKVLNDEYFRKPIHKGFATFIKALTNEEFPYFCSDETGSKTIVMTFSNIHTDILKCLGDTVKCQAERLGAYKSEKQLAETVSYFWMTSEAELLVLQCKPELDAQHLLLARSIIEEKRSAYKQVCKEKGEQRKKHVCIVIHVQRETSTNSVPWQFSFLCGWKQAFLDVLEAPPVPLNEIVSSSVPKLLTSTIWPLSQIAQNALLWCFTCIKYKRQQRPLTSILHIVKNLLTSKQVYNAIEQLVLQWVNAFDDEKDVEVGLRERWQVKVACDRQALINCSTLYSAMEHYVSCLVRQPLARIIYFLEKENAWPPHVVDPWEEDVSKTAYEDLWCKFLLREDILKLAEIREPLGPESYTLDCVNVGLHLPFSQLLIERVNREKDLFLEDRAQLMEYENNFDEDNQLKTDVQLQQMKRFSDIISKAVPEIEEFPADSFSCYMGDLFDLVSADFNAKLTRQQRVSTIKASYASHVLQLGLANDTLHPYVQLHTFVWIYKEQILDLLRMLVSCIPFVPATFSELLTVKFLSNHSNFLMDPNDDKTVAFAESAESEEGNSSKDESKTLKEPVSEEGNIAVERNDNVMLAKHDMNSWIVDKHEDDETDEGGESYRTDSDEKLDYFADILVTAYCKEMLPSENAVLNRNGGLESWMRNSCLLLSLASKISEQPTVFHFLRLCLDLARIVTCSLSSPAKETPYLLYILNDAGSSPRHDYLDAKESFEEINKNLINHLENEIKLKFSALFFGRCIDTNADACSVPTIVEHVLSLDQADQVVMMGPVILRLFLIEEMASPDVFIDVVSEPSIIGKFPCLRAIDKGFRNLSTGGEIHRDSYAAVMVCDLIQSRLNFDRRLSIEDLNSSDCKLLICASKAANVLSDNTPENCGLKLLSAVAFLRWFFTLMSRFVTENTNVLKDDSAYVHLMKDIDSFLTDPVGKDARRFSLKLFFLKQLRLQMSLFDLRKLCCESVTLPAIKTGWAIEDAITSVDKAKFVSASKLVEYQQVSALHLWKLTNDENEKEMVAFFDQCQVSSNHRMALLGILINMIYLKRAVRKLTDKEERLTAWFGEKFEQFQSPLKDLLLRIIGRKDFKSPYLQLSPESSVDEVEIALLILHISCVIASGIEKDVATSPLYQYFTNPIQCQDTFILAYGEVRKQKILEMREFTNISSFFMTCTCGFRSMFKNHQQDNQCPKCNESYQADTKSTNISNRAGISPGLTNGSLTETCSEWEWDTSMDHMNPFVFRALHLIVHACFYAGIAIELTSMTNLPPVISTGESSSSNIGEECPSPEQILYEHVITDLMNLTTILSCEKEHVLKAMHLVVERCTDLMRGSVDKTAFSTEMERKAWENKFSDRAEPVLGKALASATILKKAMKIPQKPDSESNHTLEDQIEELDDYPTELPEKHQRLKRLFRVTKEPTFEDFRAKFINSPKEFQMQHRFLSLFFAKFDELPFISYLYHLLKWTRLVSSALSYRISRKEAQLNSVNDFIHGHLLKLTRPPEEIESLKKLFSNFENAWNNMRKLVNQKLSEKEKKMPRLTEESEIAFSLIETDSGVYLRTAFEILTSLQNTILDELVYLSASYHHPALRFLEQNAHCSGIPSVSLQEAKEKDIICFHWSTDASKYVDQNSVNTRAEDNPDAVTQWSDEVFKYARNNPEYGRGDEVCYDFEQIEIVLANGLAFGKCHLTVSINKFIFSKEFFHSCGPLLSEIRKLVPQSSSLPEDVRKGLAILKECRIKEAQDLLQQIEVLIFFLKRVKCDGETTLESFADEWFSILPSPFPVSLLPQPSTSIKLKHVTALYEALEDILADGAIKAVPDQFRDNLTDDMKHQLDKKETKLSLQGLVIALRRFVFRYLSSDKFLPKPTTSLTTCLKEPSLWFPLEPPELGVIPKEFTLAYLHSVVTYLQSLDKERRSNVNKATKTGRPVFRPQGVTKGKRRGVIKF